MSDIEAFRSALFYEKGTGRLIRKDNGKVAGYVTAKGYRHVTVSGHEVAAHRVIWAITYGDWPAGLIDHINGDRDDNRLSNLRLSDHSGNAQNTTATDGRRLKGAHKHTTGRGYFARIVKDGRTHYLGYFPTEEEAHAAYLDAKARLHSFQPTPRISR